MITFSNLEKMGRLGNQLFQIAATISYSIENNDKYIFPNWKYSKYFNLNNCWGTINCDTKYVEPFFHYKKIECKNYTNLDLFGYFQSLKYFESNEYMIKSLLTPKIGYGLNDNTSIHVRRGDYVNLTNEYAQLDLNNYYNKAIESLSDDTEMFVIFSDDINWCKNIFKGSKFIFSESGDEIEDFTKMISCKNNIIANSTFSWWAAYLNQHPEKNVVAPSKWFGPKLDHNTKDLIPKEWIRI